ncbi:hypothetical protein DIPPA_09665 [Diplonema papillatum]|nr:hypothetical protein DIPPA_09665 [Diplonema papillatum]KAJ9460583.1 hypothetical protein DIPPA_09665 [Diplonema papillatum]
MWRSPSLCYAEPWAPKGLNCYIDGPLWVTDEGKLREDLLGLVLDVHAAQKQHGRGLAGALLKLEAACQKLGNGADAASVLQRLGVDRFNPAVFAALVNATCHPNSARQGYDDGGEDACLSSLASASGCVQVARAMLAALEDGSTKHVAHHLVVLHLALRRMGPCMEEYKQCLQGAFESIKAECDEGARLSDTTSEWLTSFLTGVLSVALHPSTHYETIGHVQSFFNA